jgi:hypothetical protein
MYDKAGSWKKFFSTLIESFGTFPQANTGSDLEIFFRLFSVLLHKNE